MPISFDEWKKSQDKRSSVGSAITGAVGGKPGGQSGGGSVSGSIVGAVQQQPTGQSGQSGGTMSFTEWQQQQEQSSGGSSSTVGGSILGGLGVQGGSQQQSAQGDLAAGQKLYEQRKQAQANADPWTPTLKWLGGIAQQAEQARNGLQVQVDPTETYSAWEDVKDAWEASRKANRAADYAGRDKLIKEYNAALHEMGAQRHTPEPEVQRRYEQARDRLYEQERIHGNIGLNANGELQTMSYSFGEGVGNVIGGAMGRVIGGVGSAATWLGEAAARSEYAKSAANLREMAAFYAMTGNDNASEGAYRMADTLTQRAAQRGNLEEFGGAYSFFDKQAAAGNRLVQAAKENQRPVVQMGVDVGSTALEMGFDAASGSPLVSMGVRVFGGSSQEAREAGAGFLQQGAYGAASASIEVMTEMIGGLKLYGGGQLDEVLEPALREVAGTPGGYALLRAMYTMAQEGNEEVLSDLLQPLAQSIYNGQSVGENYSQLELQDILYDWLLGAAAAFGGAVVESGGYAQDYTAMREMQQDLNAQGVETGRMTDEQLRQAYTLDKAGVNVAGLQSAENRAAGGETIGEAYDNMTQEQRQEAITNMLAAQTQRSGQTQTPTDEITRETAQEILRESLGEREAESAERILDLGSESNLREQAIAYHTIATEYGQTEGRSVEDALRSNVRGALNDTQVQHAYAYGESLRKSGQTVGVNGQTAEQGAQTANPVRRAGLVTAGTFADGNTTYKAADLSKADARDLRILNDIAKAQGVDFVLYETELGEADAEGRRSYIGANGAYRNGVVYLDINAGLTGERTEGGKTYSIGQRALLVTAAHELTHHLEHSNAAMYRQLRSFVTERLGGSDSFIGYVREAMAREDISVEAASREVVARACEEVLLDEDAIRELQGKKPTLWEQIKEWVREFVKKFQSPSGEAVEMRQYANELRRLWLGAAKEVQESAGGTADVVLAEGAAKQTGSGADISHSLRENNNITARTMAYLGKHPAAHISAEMIETANGIINEMTDYMLPYLDKDNNLGRHYLPEEVLGTTIFSDSSYGKSVENTTICFRTLAYIDFTNEIKKRIGRPLTVQESFLASQMLYDIAKEPQCLYCYVSLDRKAYDEFLGKYLKQRDGVLKAFGELSSEEQTKIVEALRGIAPEEKGAAAVYARIPLYAEFLKDESGKKRKNTAPMRQRFGLWISAAAGGKGFITAKDLTTAETRNALKEGELAEQVLDAERYAQAASWAKKLEEYRAYNGNILNMSQETVDKLNESYGLRFYSFSEYSAAFIVENMQQIRDAAAKGLYGLAYTKKPDFARIFAGTGININISTFGRWGVDAQGKRVVVMDDLQGANWDEVKQLRDDFKNVGAVFVATDDAMVDWALAQDWIDVVIPFHIVRAGADVANFYKWVVHNQDQADKTKKGKAKDITPPEHQNDRATFLALAKERGLTPRFSKWLGNEHYMKLVNETRQPTKNSTPLKPVFDLKAAKQSFDDFVDEGGYYGNWYKEKTEQTGPVAYSYEEAVDQVVSDVKAGRKANEVSYGRQDIDVVAENFGKARQNAPRAHGQAMGNDVQRSARSDVTQGLNFRDASGELLERVFGGIKKYETRAYTDGKTNGRLPEAYLNKPMGIIQTGSGKAKLVGYWELGNGVLRDSKWLSEHRAELGNDGTEFEATPGEKKWVYPIKWAERTDPVEVTSYGIRARDISDVARGSKNAAPDTAYTGEITQYSLRGVEPVEPKSDAWKRGFTAEEVRRMYAGFRKSDAKNEYVEDSGKSYEERKTERIRLAQREKAGKRGNGTQRANTAPTYDRLYDTLEHEGFNGTILDASSGLGIGTDHGIQRGFDVEDIEPFYGEGYRPIFSDYSRLDKQYDVVISSAVINVLTQDDSDAMVTAIGKALKPGGRAFITVRSASAVDGSLKGGESKRLSQNAHEWVVPGSDNYQRGFETDELRAYLEDVLGPGFTVESSPKFYDKATDKWQKWGDTSAIVTRKNAAPAMQRSAQAAEAEQQTGTDTTQRSVRSEATNVKGELTSVTDSEQFKRWFKGSKIVNADGSPRVVYHQTFGGFTSFSNENPVAGANDSETPNGYFFKQNDHDIGLDGKQQLSFYLKIENPLHFKDRKEANAWYQKNVPGYKALQDEMDRKISPINKTIDELDDAYFMRDEITEEQYDQRWNALIAQMTEIENRYRGQLRGLLDDYFLKHDSGYDGIELDYDGHRYVDGKRENVHTYIAFKNTQMKSATDNVGTFDETDSNFQHSVRSDAMTDREILMLAAEEYGEESKEKRESIANLKAENEILRARAEYWKGQTRQTRERTVRQQDTDRLANDLLRRFDSRADKQSVKQKIRELGNWLVQNDADGLSYDELHDRARSIAEEIVGGNYTLIDDSQAEAGQRFRDYLKRTPVKLTEEDWSDTGDEGFRRRYGRYFTVSERGRTLDSLWGELAATFGDGAFPEDIYAPGDMLNMIGNYIDTWKPRYGNVFEANWDEAVDAAAGEIIDRVLGEEVRQTPATFADRAQQKLNAQIAKDKAKLDALREAKNARIDDLKHQTKEKNSQLREFRDAMARYQNYDEAAQEHLQKLGELQQERKTVTDMRTSTGEITPQEKQQRLDALDKQIASERKEATRAEQNAARALSRVTQLEKDRALQDILVKERAAQRQRTRDKANERLLKRDARKTVEKRAKVLYDMLMKNSDKQHVPEMLKEPLGAFLQGLDFSSNRLLAGGEETKRDAKFGAALQKISTMLNEQQAWLNGDENAKNGDFGAFLDISSENLQFLKGCSELVTQALSEHKSYTVNQMSGADLKALGEFLQNLTTAVRKMNNFMANARFESVRAAAAADIEHMNALGKAAETAGSGLSKTVMWDNGTPFYVLKRFGDGAKSIFDSFAKGWEKMAFNAKEVIDFTAEAYTTKEVNAWKSEMHDFTLEDGSEIRMTTAQIMALSALIGREQAMKHIEQGGIRIGDIQTKKGEIHDTTHYHFSEADIAKVIGSLTERQAEVAGKLQKFMAKKGAEWGNEVSMKRFGYRFYTEGDAYYPIKTDSNDRPMADTDAQENSMFRLLNLSSSKSLNPNASNALIVDDIFDTFADHMADMAKLNGMGLPVLDAIKWFNYKERIDRGDGTYDTKTLQGAMEQAFGKQAQRYFSTLMKDINGVKESGDRGGEWQGKLISNYKVAAVGANLRVMLLQPTSYVRALTLIKPRYLAGALFSKNAYKEALKYSGTAVWKALGYYDTNISRSMREQIQHSDSFGDQVKEISMTGAEFGDKWTWGGLWTACKMQTRAETKLSGEELNRATADLFRDVIYSSQVMDSTLTRSQSMRASGKFTKLKTAFMAEPTLSYNILLDAYSQTSLDIRKYGRSEGWKRNTGKMAHAFAVYAISASFSALVESFVDALRDDDDEEFVDKFLDALIGEVDKAGKRALLKGNLMQDLTIIGKIPELKDLISLFQGYGSRDMSVTAIGELKDAYEVWRETVLLQKGILDKATKTTYYGNMTLWGKIYKTLTALSHLSGYAVSNLTRDALALWNTFVPSMKIKTYEGRGAAAQAQRYIEAYRAGDRDKMWEIASGVGTDRSGFNSQISAEIRTEYIDGDISEAQAIRMLRELRGLSNLDAQDKLREWEFEKTQGYAYDKLKQTYLSGDVSEAQAMKFLRETGDKTQGEAERTMREWKFEKTHGYPYSDLKGRYVDGKVSQADTIRYVQEVTLNGLPDVKETVLHWQCLKDTGIEYDKIDERLQGGDITLDRAAGLWQKYGGMSQEDAKLKANYVTACGASAGLKDKLTQGQYKAWYNYARSAGVKVEVYADIRSTANTDEQSNISQSEAAAAITRALNSGQITRAQAEAIWKSFNKSWTTTYADYVAKHK